MVCVGDDDEIPILPSTLALFTRRVQLLIDKTLNYTKINFSSMENEVLFIAGNEMFQNQSEI
jgi:hypothetical protein